MYTHIDSSRKRGNRSVADAATQRGKENVASQVVVQRRGDGTGLSGPSLDNLLDQSDSESETKEKGEEKTSGKNVSENESPVPTSPQHQTESSPTPVAPGQEKHLPQASWH